MDRANVQDSDVPRVLFLDDDPTRAAKFLADFPHATWVQTTEECIARLREPWDEVHLDHDLGGETFVSHERDDCGMAVVRWLCDNPSNSQHLKQSRFYVHTHNPDAACMMVLHLQVMGFSVVARPFGAPPRGARRGSATGGVGAMLRRWVLGRRGAGG